MRILITAGGTSENIDSVRKITNSSSGRLGAIIAERLMEDGHELIYVHGKGAKLPEGEYEKHPIIGVRDLQKTMKEILTTQKINVVIHAMAVSDYFVDYVTTPTLAAKDYAEADNGIYERMLAGRYRLDNSQKLSSDEEALLIMLKKSPKVISEIKTYAPDVRLIGFKLLSGATYEELEAAALKQIKTSGSDLVVANDIRYIDDKQHFAWFANRDGFKGLATTKEGIAAWLSWYLER